MAIDPSIALQGRLPQFDDSLAKYAQFEQIKAGRQQNKLTDLLYGEKLRGIEQENALTGAYKSAFNPATGKMDNAALRAYLGGLGNYAGIQALDTQEAAQSVTRADAAAKNFTTAKQQFEIAGQIVGGWAIDPQINKQKILAGLTSAQNIGLISEDIAKAKMAELDTIGEDPASLNDWAKVTQSQVLSSSNQLDQKWKAQDAKRDADKFDYQQSNDAANRAVTVQGQRLTDARGRESNALKQQEIAAGGKPPAGYRWKGDGSLEAIPGGPGEKLPESQQKQVVGVNNLSNAIKEYREQLKTFGVTDAALPDSRAAMGTKYNNMMLQAKEAYNLGVLNGPDLDILTSVITDPRSLKGIVTSRKALDAQASELDRIMGQVGRVSAKRNQPQSERVKPAAAGGAKFLGFE